jgi:hypothetical protein
MLLRGVPPVLNFPAVHKDIARTASLGSGGGSDDDDFPTAGSALSSMPIARGLGGAKGGSDSRAESDADKRKPSKSTDKDKKKKSSGKKDKNKDKRDKDKRDKDKRDKDKKTDIKKEKKKDEDADDLLASFGKALTAPAPKAKAFDPLGGMGGAQKFDPLGGGRRGFDPLGSQSGSANSLTSLVPGLGGPAAGKEPAKPSAVSDWASAPTGSGRGGDKAEKKPEAAKQFNVLDAAKLIQSSGVRQYVETQNSGYNPVRKPGKSAFGAKKEGLADLSILSEESGSNGESSPEPESPGQRLDSPKRQDPYKPAAHAAEAQSRTAASSSRTKGIQPFAIDASGAKSAPAPTAAPATTSAFAAAPAGSSLGNLGKFGNIMMASDLLADLSAPEPSPAASAKAAPASGAEGKTRVAPMPVVVKEEGSSDFDIDLSEADIDLSDNSTDTLEVRPPAPSASRPSAPVAGTALARVTSPEEIPELRGTTPKSSHSASSVLSNVHFASELSSLDDAEDSSGFGSGKFGNIRLEPSPPISPPIIPNVPPDPVIIKAVGTGPKAAPAKFGYINIQRASGLARTNEDEDDDDLSDADLAPSPSPRSHTSSGDSDKPPPAPLGGDGRRGGELLASDRLILDKYSKIGRGSGGMFSSNFGNVQSASALVEKEAVVVDTFTSKFGNLRSASSLTASAAKEEVEDTFASKFGNLQMASSLTAAVAEEEEVTFASKFGNLQMASALSAASPAPQARPHSRATSSPSDSLPSRTPSPGSPASSNDGRRVGDTGISAGGALGKFGNIHLASDLLAETAGRGAVEQATARRGGGDRESGRGGGGAGGAVEIRSPTFTGVSSKFGNLQLASDLADEISRGRPAAGRGGDLGSKRGGRGGGEGTGGLENAALACVGSTLCFGNLRLASAADLLADAALDLPHHLGGAAGGSERASEEERWRGGREGDRDTEPVRTSSVEPPEVVSEDGSAQGYDVKGGETDSGGYEDDFDGESVHSEGALSQASGLFYLFSGSLLTLN